MTISVNYIVDNEDLLEAFSLREEVFVTEQKVRREDEFDQHENESYHFIAKAGDMVCGAARYRYTDEGVKLERFAVKREFRGRSVGSTLMEVMLQHIQMQPQSKGKKLYLNAQVTAMSLYRKFDFQPVGERFMECGIEHQKMLKQRN